MRRTIGQWANEQIARAVRALLAEFGYTAVRTESLNQFESDYVSCLRANGARYWKRWYISRL